MWPRLPYRPEGEETVRFEALRDGERRLLGKDNHLGLLVLKAGGRVLVYPRLCPHEGAGLDQASADENCTVMCPWHGRRFKPILSLELPPTPRVVETPWHRYVVGRDALTVVCKPADEAPREADWSRQAV